MLSFKARAKFCTNPTPKRLFSLMEEKKSNLALAVDVTSCKKLLKIAQLLGPQICVLKTHVDVLEDFSLDFIEALSQIAKKEGFLLFEDRKFADIGNTVSLQYGQGIYKIATWADLTNAHILPGPGIVEALRQVGEPLGRGLLLLAEMSSEGAFMDASYAAQAVAMAKDFPDFVVGFIAQKRLIDDPRFLFLTPGIHLHAVKDSLGQKYKTPEEAVASGSDVLIVGRAILEAKDPLHEAFIYRKAAWDAYAASLDS